MNELYEREAFELWAQSIGLFHESFGIRSESRQMDLAWRAWKAAVRNGGRADASHIDKGSLMIESADHPTRLTKTIGVPVGIKMTHASGIQVICHAERSQHANRDRALAGMVAMLPRNDQ